MRLALCDDDKELIEELKPIMYQYANRNHFDMLIDEYYCGEDLLEAKIAYDMIFIDYQMGKMTGLNMAKKLRDKNMHSAITFMTAYPGSMRDAFEARTFRFLEKPLDQSKIYAVLDDYLKMCGDDYPILLQHEKAIIQVSTKEIVFLEAMNKHCMVHLPEEKLYVAKTMAAVSRMLPQSHFFKVNRAYIVNFNYIYKYSKEDIFFINGEKARASRKYLPIFKKEYRAYSDLRNPKRQERQRQEIIDLNEME